MSRSLINGGTPTFAVRNILNPVTVLGGAVLVTSTCAGGNSFSLTKPERAMLNTIESKYTIHLEDKQYEKIPNDLVSYLTLYSALSKTRVTYRTHKDVSLLLKITAEALAGAIAAYGLNARIIELHIQNLYLQEVIETMISGVNIKPAFDMNSGGLCITKELKLAPLFMYYIQTYGTPEPGDGFDPDKLTIIYNTLINNGIDPGIVNIQSIIPSDTCTTKTALVDLYHQLSLFVNSVKTLQDAYSSGNVSAVAHILTVDVYSQMSAQLEALAFDLNVYDTRAFVTVSDMYEDYENIRKNTGLGLLTLHKACLQYATLEDTTLKYLNAKEKMDILLDPVKLKKYIDDMNKRTATHLFPESIITAKKAIIKPEYAEYIKRYGYPQGGAFDSDKLGQIVQDLGLNTSPITNLQINTVVSKEKSMNDFITRSQKFKTQSKSQK